jgi:hypothetical protein
MLKLLDAMGGKPTLSYGGSVFLHLIPVKEPLLGYHLWPLQQQVLPGYPQVVDAIDGVTPRCDVGRDEAARIKESKDHLLAAALLHLGLNPNPH